MLIEHLFLMFDSQKDDPGGGPPNSGPGAGDSKGGSDDDDPPGGDKDGKPPKDGKGGDKGGDSEPDLDDLPEAAQKYVKNLRKENARYRNQAKRLEGDLGDYKKRISSLAGAGKDDDSDADPEEVIGQLHQGLEVTAFENAVLKEALRHGVSGEDSLEYFSFLMNKRCGELGEDEELDEEDIAEIAKKANGRSGGGSSTSVDGKGAADGKEPPPMKDGDVNFEQFLKMSMPEKSKLYNERPALYSEFMKKARAENRIV